jgi:hypothetical protein
MIPPPIPPQSMQSEIRLRGYLNPRWAHRFDGFEIRDLPDGTTLLVGEVIDQAALHGILRQISDIGIPLLEVKCCDEYKAG